ncbi:MAG: DUF488 domain-containing protein, partial [Deltaproteobacteria bacterium]|nr:DUF488 domain-containing protein [Deltaproteobacteria bacterium]
SMNTIYTIGTSNRPSLEFINILIRYGIQILVDVRRFPSSRFPWFKREKLAAACRNGGIDYRWMGDLLGAFRKEAYEQYCQTEAFRKGVECLEELAETRTIALCCAERLPWKCHRRFIARELEKLGRPVTHILDSEEEWQSPQGELF